MIVMDESTCMVDVAKYFMGFLKDESCGKCYTCRKGTQRMWEILDDITQGKGTLAHLDLLEELGQTVTDASMCGLGQSAANPVLSTLRYFRGEYERHVIDRVCDAYVCKGLTGAPCQSACPVGTEAWRYAALIARGEFEEAYRVIRTSNPFPSVCARVCDHKCEQHCRLGKMGQDPLALRALKRFITDRVDPSVYRPERRPAAAAAGRKIAIVGAGPAGLTAAHNLSLRGYPSTVFEAADRPGGLLTQGIPAFRLPPDVVQKEIDALIDENITLRCGMALGRDFTVDSLFEDGFDAVFLAVGAHQSWRMDIPGEDLTGVHPSMEFLKAWNVRGESLAHGRVGVIGGGNSAIDAARVALRQEGVSAVTIFYRRTRQEMPAFPEEIDGAIEEGVELELLVSPERLLGQSGRLTAAEFVVNELGEIDKGGRRRPVAKPGSEYRVPLDTLIVAISEAASDVGAGPISGLEFKDGAVAADNRTLTTGRPGLFAGGDLATGPNTVIDAIAAGKRAADVIERYLWGRDLVVPSDPHLPTVYIEPMVAQPEDGGDHRRVRVLEHSPEQRRCSFAEVEETLTPEDADREARRCLRCDLDFTSCPDAENAIPTTSRGHR
jgi:NADH-quinone oxidoreductase subunit F